MADQPIRVFISYSHDSAAHAAQVLDLANRLRTQGIDAWIDQYEIAPPQGWPRWMQEQLELARFVLLVCTPTYKLRFEGKEEPGGGAGKGARWEGLIAQQMLYDARTLNDKLIPVLFDPEHYEAIPLVLRPYQHHRLPSDYDGLYRHLTGQPAAVPPALGPVSVMPPVGSGSSPHVAVSTSPAPPSTIAPMPARSSGMPEVPPLMMSQAQRDRLVRLLLDCPTFHEQASRDRVVARLGSSIAPYIARHSRPNMDADAIVETCANRDYGIERLVEAVRWAEGDTHQMRAIDEFVKSL